MVHAILSLVNKHSKEMNHVNSLKGKILIVTLSITLLSFLLIGTTISLRINQQLQEDTTTQLLKDARVVGKEMDTFFSKYGMLVQQMAMNPPDLVNMVLDYNDRSMKRQHPNYDKVSSVLLNIKESDPNLSLVWLGIEPVNDLITDDYGYDKGGEDYDMSQRSWFKEMQSNSGLTYTDPYLDGVTGELVISILYPVTKNNQVIGNVGIDLKITDIATYMKSYQIGDQATPPYWYLVKGLWFIILIQTK